MAAWPTVSSNRAWKRSCSSARLRSVIARIRSELASGSSDTAKILLEPSADEQGDYFNKNVRIISNNTAR